MGNEAQITSILNEILKVEAIEEAFSCIIVHNPSNEKEKIKGWQSELASVMAGLGTEQQENAIRRFLYIAAEITNYKRMHLVLSLLENLVSTNVLPARLVCECIFGCEKLQYQNKEFWVECFTLIRHIIGGVDYKGVREILKACEEKAHILPVMIDASVQSQMKACEHLIEYIFDRNACLIPCYLIVNELQKFAADKKNWPHWLAKLISNFIDSFRNVVQMISIIGHSKMLPLVEHSGYGDHLVSPWLLDRNTLQFSLKGLESLPYDPELLKPQTNLLRYVLEQPYSRDMVCSMLKLQKQQNLRCKALEEQLVDLMIRNMEKSENEPTPADDSDGVITNFWPWLHLSSQLIHYVIFQFVSFPSLITAIHDRLAGREWKKARDHLMWVLLQFISGSIQRNPLTTFLPIFKLYDLLYPEKDPLPVPDLTHIKCTHEMALICIWLHLLRKAQTENSNCHRPIPHNLKMHNEFLQHAVTQPNLAMGTDYRIVLLCNAYSTQTANDYFTRSINVLFESIQKSHPQQPLQNLQSNTSIVHHPTTPLSMSILDSLTVHAKMNLIHNIVQHMMKNAHSKSNMTLPPALVETYSRLLVYTEIEVMGIKSFINQLLPTIFKAHAWGTLYTLLDMFSYRMHHIQPTYRVQILSHLHNLASVPQTNQTQLHLCVESTALRLITGLGSAEVQPHLSRFLSEPKTLISADSEELNRALVLTLARSMHITGTGADTVSGTWCQDLLNTIMQNTPHSWADHTLQCFPPILSEFFQQNSVPKEEKQQIKKAVEEEYRNWASMSNENDIIAHFSVSGSPPLFLCLLWKMIIETDRISPIAYKILERIGARALSAHLRKFCDYIVFEVSSIAADGSYVNKGVDAINDMIWKYNIFTFDRLVLCLALRTLEGNEAQVCFFIIQLLLLKAAEFRNRVAEFVKENSPDHWKQSNWHEKHLAFHRKFPEKFAPEGIMEQASGSPNQYQSFPAYFGNVCLRFLPVLDIVMHRYLEIPQVTKSLEVLLEHLGCLYRFHDRPVTYLYNTLHYYERQLRDKPILKRRLVIAILGSLRETKTPGWALSDAYQRYIARAPDDLAWQPELDYYVRLVQRLVDTIYGTIQFPPTDWRFNEFPNPAAHTLYVTCVELMALPVAPNVVANNLLDVVAKGYTVIPSDEIHSWINCIGIIMSALPECYWSILHERLVQTASSSGLVNWQYDNLSPFQLFNFNLTHNSFFENKYSYMLALAHSIWHHAGVGQMFTMVQFIKEKLQPVINTEEQLIFACHLIGPTLNRFNSERPKCITDLTIMLYEMLEQVNRAQTHLRQMDPICDLFYHIKYMFVGNSMKNEVETIIRRLRPALQMRLRFIAHLNVEEIQSS
ncbi:mediator of RNA polymerase II transcription subunit 23 isoform X2 [Nasonia vitripennis]|uniref:Mediator of RNA polymerase II transcription subunit 23 n=1 Tax=Nasonia vitripennis TaxID=7425 RepID=A0A7M7HGU9_NASVI|nr:mediator of RNA polymerase II transcription subunit 23 isoform X2 [Nasonia vitripennis]